MSSSTHRVLILSHGHPMEHPGGGEVAAYQEHQELLRQGTESLFLAASLRPKPHADSPFSTIGTSSREVLFHGDSEALMLSQTDLRSVCRNFDGLLRAFRPTVVHFHHFTNLGLELIRAVRRYSRRLPIVLTLHEHLAICHNRGHMTKTYDGSLCRDPSPNRCHQCFPEISAGQFLLRDLWVRSVFRLVDRFITPSEYLRQRFIAWGIEDQRIEMIENGQPPVEAVPLRTLGPGERRDAFAFLGQVAPHKGIGVLLEGFEALPKPEMENAKLTLFGGNLRFQPDAFRSMVEANRARGIPGVTWSGPYTVEQIPSLLAGVDWVIVPSIWWENSPLVIQEAFAHRRPVICSDIGGMAEKVEEGVSGLHFRMGNARSLAETMTRAALEAGLHERLSKGIHPAPSIAETCGELLNAFDVLENRSQLKLETSA